MSDKVAEIPQEILGQIAEAERIMFNRKPSIASDYQQGGFFVYYLAQQEIAAKDKEIERLGEELKTEIGYKNMHRRFRDAIDSDDE